MDRNQTALFSPGLLMWRVPTHSMHALYKCPQQHALYVSAQVSALSLRTCFFSVCERLRVSTLLSGMETLLYSSTSARGRHCNGQKAKQTIMSVV